MAKSTIDVFKCDRCPAEVQHRDSLDLMGWTNFALALSAPEAAALFEPIGTVNPAHLCPECTAQLVAYMTGENLKAKARPKPPPERKRAALSIADVKGLSDEISKILCERVEGAFAYANRYPEEFDGKMPPLPVEALKLAAEEVVDGFVSLHGLRADG